MPLSPTARIRIRRRTPRIAALGAFACASVLAGTAGAAQQPPELISRASGEGAAGNGPSMFPSVSGDGRLVAFRSESTNLVTGDQDTIRDVFVRDRATGSVVLVSRASGAGGEKGNRPSYNPRLSADGRYLAYRSNATNLHPDDTDANADIFVRDLQTHETTLISRASGANGAKGAGGSFNPSISGDGRRVAFRSAAPNLHPDDPDTIEDVFVRDLRTNETILVSRAGGPAGAKGTATSQFPAISTNGERVAFRSEAPNLHPDDPDTTEDIFVRDLRTNETILVSRAAGDGPKGNARSTFVALSADGSIVAFDSLSTNLHPDDPDGSADVFARDLGTGSVELISRASGPAGEKAKGSAEPSVSGDGRFVAFHSVATNLDPADPDKELDAYVRDRELSRTMVLSSPTTGGDGGPSYEPWISENGKLVVFHSEADDLHPGDLNGIEDVFAVRVPKVPRCKGKQATLFAAAGTVTRGTRGPDVIVGSDGHDKIKSGRGKDRVCGLDGDDVIATGGGADKAWGAGGNDVIRTGRGRDKAVGNGGKDRLNGGRGPDRLKGGGGRDRVKGGPGSDKLIGGSGRDRCIGNAGKDKTRRCETVRD